MATESLKRRLQRKVGYALFHLFSRIASLQQRMVTDRASCVMSWMERKHLCCSRHGWQGDE